MVLLPTEPLAQSLGGGAILWAGGTAPTLTSTSGKKDFFAFYTSNAGMNWYAMVMGQNFTPFIGVGIFGGGYTSDYAAVTDKYAYSGDTVTAGTSLGTARSALDASSNSHGGL